MIPSPFNGPVSVYRFPRQAPTLCPQLCMAFNLAPVFLRGALTLCPQLCMGISPMRYTEIGQFSHLTKHNCAPALSWRCCALSCWTRIGCSFCMRHTTRVPVGCVVTVCRYCLTVCS
jgi:hypothetical protein